VRYDVPEQDLSYPLSRIPTRPRSGVVVENVVVRDVVDGPARRQG
jgi:hypothetical protein